MNLIERPLASLPTRLGERFVRALFAPDQRFARAFHHYWKVVLAQDDITARANTQRELAEASAKLIANLGDPDLHTIGIAGIAYEPIGIFGYRELEAHPFGRKIAEVVAAGPLAARCRGPLGIAHCVSMLDAYARIEILKMMFASIARKAQARDHAQLFFFTSDHRLEGLYRKLGMEFPPELALRDSQHLVGMFDLSTETNRVRIDKIDAAARTHQVSFESHQVPGAA